MSRKKRIGAASVGRFTRGKKDLYRNPFETILAMNVCVFREQFVEQYDATTNVCIGYGQRFEYGNYCLRASPWQKSI